MWVPESGEPSPPFSTTRFRSLTSNYLNFERYRGVFETTHGIGESVRGRALGAIDHLVGSSESKSRHSSIADRGRMEVETGMAHIYGYPDPNAANALHNEPGRPSQSNTGAFGGGHTTATGPGAGYTRTVENDYDSYRRGGDVDGGVGRGTGGYGADDGYGQPGAQNFEHRQTTIDGKREMGPDPSGRGGLVPNRGPQNAGPEAGRPSMPQPEVVAPTQQKMKRDPPPELTPRAQAQATDNDQTAQMYQ